MDKEDFSKFDVFLQVAEDVQNCDMVTASKRFDYLIHTTALFPYIKESWKCSKAVLLALLYGEKSERYEDALRFIEGQYPPYSDLCKYDYGWKASINFAWALLLVKVNKLHEALEKTKIGVLMQFVDNTSYDGWEFFSFRGCTKYVFSEIADEEISLMHPDEFNDPMDTALIQWLKNQEKIATDMVGKQLAKNNIDALKNLRIRCFSRTHRLPYRESDKDLLRLRKHKNQEIRKINPLMWAHYADEHKGICIKYRFKADFFNLINAECDEIFRFANVEYQPSLDLNSLEITLRDALFTKSKVWSYEHEVRLLYYSTKDTPRVKTVHVPGAIEAIYLGLRCSEADERIIKALVKDRNIPIYRMYTDVSNVYKLKYKQV